MPIKNVLVVDDSPTERFFAVDVLTKAGYQVTTAENGEDGSRNTMHPFDRYFLCGFIAEQYRRYVSQHHAERRASDYKGQGLIFGRQRHRCHLCFITHFRQEKCNQRGTKDAEMRQLGVILIKLVRN